MYGNIQCWVSFTLVQNKYKGKSKVYTKLRFKVIEQYVWKEASPIATLVLECLHQCVQSCLKLFFAKQTKDIQQYIDI